MSEEIIIDGVNVAGCEFAVKPINDNRIKCHCAKGLLQIAKMQEQPENIKSGLCENNPNCYYKRLKRLQAENEWLKETNKKLKYFLNKIRDDELYNMDVEWDDYITECSCTEYSNIINFVELALGERNE